MITITQNKVAGFEPRWAPFPGFSVLFDNPGGSLTVDGDLLKITCSAAAGDQLELYSGLEKALEKLGRDLLVRTYLFCPLPLSSYHMTVWDGINIENIGSVKPEVRSDWAAFLDGLALSLKAPPASMEIVTRSALMGWSRNISFQFETLALWGNQVLVARLRPAYEASERRLEDLSARRTDLSETAGRELGMDVSRSYSPHISLGYFGNQEHAQLAHAQIEPWTERFREELRDSVITYASLDIYGFTDMASFFKVPGLRRGRPLSPG